MTAAPHTEWFTIYTFQEDLDGAARMRALCDYMQEAAGNHAAALGVAMERLYAEGLAWVLARLRIAPLALPLGRERIRVETWPVNVEGVQFRRDFILRREDGTVFARAVSHWVVVSLESRKVGRIPAFIADKALENAATAMDDAKSRLAGAGEEYAAGTFRARLADLDRNLHVNNVRYLEWILESVPDDARAHMRLADLEMVFRAESFWNDIVVARTMPEEGGNAFAHSLVREADGKELVRARSVWTPD